MPYWTVHLSRQLSATFDKSCLLGVGAVLSRSRSLFVLNGHGKRRVSGFHWEWCAGMVNFPSLG